MHVHQLERMIVFLSKYAFAGRIIKYEQCVIASERVCAFVGESVVAYEYACASAGENDCVIE